MSLQALMCLSSRNKICTRIKRVCKEWHKIQNMHGGRLHGKDAGEKNFISSGFKEKGT